MKQIDVIYSESLDSIIGPVQTIKRIIRDSSFFEGEGYRITVYTKSSLPTQAIARVKKKKSHLVKTILKIARWFAQNSYLYAKYRIELFYTETHRLLDYYMSLDRHPDAIVFHSTFDSYEYFMHYKKDGVKIIQFTHSDGFVNRMLFTYFSKAKGTSIEKTVQQREKYVMDHIDMNACIAKIEEKNLIMQYPQIKGRTHQVINGIDDLSIEVLNESRAIRKENSTPKYRLACAGGINGRKGQWMIIEAMHKLPRHILGNMHLYLIGDGPEKIVLENRVADYGLQNNVTFEGSVPNTEVYKYLAKANIFVLMSAIEGLPIALLEA